MVFTPIVASLDGIGASRGAEEVGALAQLPDWPATGVARPRTMISVKTAAEWGYVIGTAPARVQQGDRSRLRNCNQGGRPTMANPLPAPCGSCRSPFEFFQPGVRKAFRRFSRNHGRIRGPSACSAHQ